jgi:stage III sporulation protein AG
MKKSVEKFQQYWKKYRYAALILLLGVALLVLPSGKKSMGEKAKGQAEELGETTVQTEKKMRQILSEIRGVGNLQIMLTVESGGEQHLAQNSELSYSGSSQSPEDCNRRSETVVVSDDGSEKAVVTKSSAPVYRGALVVCQGAGNPDVKLAVTEAVSALTGLSSDRITVVKCQ